MRPDRAGGQEDLPETTEDGCISDFDNVDVINCTYGDKSATRTIALAGGSHAEHWITALDLLGKLHHFKVVTYLKMGCPLTTEQVPLVMGDNRPYPKCHTWNEQVMTKTHRRPPRLRVHHLDPAVEHQTRRRDAGHLRRDLANAVGQQHSRSWRCGTPRGWYAGGKPFFPADCLADGGNGISCGIRRSDVLSRPTRRWTSSHGSRC